MAEVRDPASEMEAAELAAGAGDFTSAEQHLNRAVELEEVSFGPMHAGLASILNNLGVVYERLNRARQGGGLLPARVCRRKGLAAAGRPGHRAERGEPSRVLRGTRHSVRALHLRA